jgi:hypothetical protein
MQGPHAASTKSPNTTLHASGVPPSRLGFTSPPLLPRAVAMVLAARTAHGAWEARLCRRRRGREEEGGGGAEAGAGEVEVG